MLDATNNYSIPPKKFSPHINRGGMRIPGTACCPTGLQTVESFRQTQELRSHFAQPLQIPERKIPVPSMKDEWESFFAFLDLDSCKLFRIIRQKNGHHTVPSTQLISRGKTCEGPKVLDCWASHFCNLASPTTSPSFDNNFHSTISRHISPVNHQQVL